MKLLGLRICGHDSNISYFDGKKVHYFKSERFLQEKHHGYNNLKEWELDLKKIWGLDINNIDEMGIVFDPWVYNLPEKDKIFPHINFSELSVNIPTIRIDHHLAHSLSIWPIYNFSPNISIIIDGFGDWNISWTVIKNNKILDRGYVDTNGSLGVSMGHTGMFLDIPGHPDDLSGKLMGLQSYGNLNRGFLESLNNFNLSNIKDLFNFDLWVDYHKDKLVSDLNRLDWIHTIHYKVGQILVEFFSKYCSSNDYISYTGGVAQNVVWNTELKKHFPNLIIPPHCNDEGLSLGIIEYLRQKNNLPPFTFPNFPYAQSDEPPLTPPSDITIKKTAQLLSEGKIVAWYQNQGEIGPRALGNRSILFNPLISNGKEIVNQVKRRENYRPFGATVLEERAKEFFDLKYPNPFMLYTSRVKSLNLSSITHIDNTCRVQTINQNQNPYYYKLIKEFENLTNLPILLNTSLNINGKPIAGYIKDAYRLLFNSKIDYLVIGDKIIKND